MRSPVRIRVAAPNTPDTLTSVGALAFIGDFRENVLARVIKTDRGLRDAL